MFKRIAKSISVAIIVSVFALIPLLTFADVDPEHGHEEIPAVQNASQVPIDIGNNDFIGDEHTDHTHAAFSKVVWYKDQMWWTFFLISVFLLTVLSLWVHKLIRVENHRTTSKPSTK